MGSSKKTEPELISAQKQNIYLLDKLISNARLTISEVEDLIPGIFHLNSVEDLSLQYVAKNGQDFFGRNMEDIREIGAAFFEKILSRETRNLVIPKFLEFAALEDPSKTCTEFQIVRRDDDDIFKPHISSLKILKSLNSIAVVTIPLDHLSTHTNKIERLLGEEVFFRKNFERFQSLTKREKEVLTLIGEGLTNKKIADHLFLSSHTIRTHRNRIFKKLEIKNFRDIIKYVQAYEL